jgi:Zn-dependent protease with chaperone function
MRQVLALVAIASLVFAPVAQAERTRLKPGWNLFSPAQDIELGRRVSVDAERQLPMLNDRRVDDYLTRLGRRLASKAPGEAFPYQFKAVNDRTINAFALPGGYVYIHRGIIEAADTEAQLAGVIAHEIGHVALRHGTNQASKQYAAQLPLAILGGALGSNSIGALLTQLGAQFTVGSILLKYSRDAERQADILGAQILYDCNYDPRAIPQFFEKIQNESKGGGVPQFFSSHPNPENRQELVTAEIEKMGGPPRNYKADSAEFQEIKRYVLALPAPPKPGQRPARSESGARPGAPSTRMQTFQNGVVRFQYPDNWRAYTQGNAATVAPEGGLVDDGSGRAAVAYGVILGVFDPQTDRWGQTTLEDANTQLLNDIQRNNPRAQVTRSSDRVRVGGERGLSTYLSNDSSLGGRETIWVLSVLRPEGLVFFACVAPENDFDTYNRAFQALLDSVRFPR